MLADYYDGRSTRRHAVQLELRADGLHIAGDGIARREAWSAVEIAEETQGAPRLLRLAGGAYCAVAEREQLARQLAAINRRSGLVQRGQQSWAAAVLAAAAVLGLLAAAYLWGVPIAADFAARRLPAPLVEKLSAHSLNSLDENLLEVSALPEGRRAGLEGRLDELSRGATAPIAHQLLFRACPPVGPNAFAFPDGRIVLLDELAGLTAEDDEIIAVLAHELGHVRHRHGLRLLFQTAAVGALAAWWFGDVSFLLTAAPAALLNSRYSREFEREADEYAVQLLKAQGIAPAALAEILQKLETAHRSKADAGQHWLNYLSSHPTTPERIEALRGP